MGGSLLTWHGVTLPSPPTSWHLHSADVADPKAKVQPTEAEYRKRYLENIVKMVANAGKYATYTAEIKPLVGNDSASGPGLGLGLPAITLGPGVLAFDQEAAALIPSEQNLREQTQLWSLTWGISPLTFVHRATARKLVAYAASMGSGDDVGSNSPTRLSLVMTKTSVGTSPYHTPPHFQSTPLTPPPSTPSPYFQSIHLTICSLNVFSQIHPFSSFSSSSHHSPSPLTFPSHSPPLTHLPPPSFLLVSSP